MCSVSHNCKSRRPAVPVVYWSPISGWPQVTLPCEMLALSWTRKHAEDVEDATARRRAGDCFGFTRSPWLMCLNKTKLPSMNGCRFSLIPPPLSSQMTLQSDNKAVRFASCGLHCGPDRYHSPFQCPMGALGMRVLLSEASSDLLSQLEEYAGFEADTFGLSPLGRRTFGRRLQSGCNRRRLGVRCKPLCHSDRREPSVTWTEPVLLLPVLLGGVGAR
ncbi:hypothetical protein OH77DRAFT_882839 [Trametes cingulata]|nr:hypothetical protein OH77DRAFT_882839 [Trametes cingulata]